MDAGSLGRVLRQRDRVGIPEPALAEVAARCLAGLAHLHYSCGVAHLDVKPDNLLADGRGNVRIGDFSVSRIFSRIPGERLQVSVGVGSTAYMSPERFAPNARAGPRGACAADVWSLGITVLELLSGRCPILPAASWEMLKEAICYGEPPSVPESASASLRGVRGRLPAEGSEAVRHGGSVARAPVRGRPRRGVIGPRAAADNGGDNVLIRQRETTPIELGQRNNAYRAWTDNYFILARIVKMFS
jgi:mitogen-activated protein kinase kinase